MHKIRSTKEQNEKLKNDMDRAIQTIEDMKAYYKDVFNSAALKSIFENHRKRNEIIQQVYKDSGWEKLIKQQLESRKRIINIIDNVNKTSSLNLYKNYLNNLNKKSISRIESLEIDNTADFFEKKAIKNNDREVKKLIRQVKKEINLKKEERFIVYFTNDGRLFTKNKNSRKEVNITSHKLITLLSLLASSNRYIKTEELYTEAKYKSKKSMRNAIAIVRKKFKELGFNDGDPIDGKQGHGYILHKNIYLQISPEEYM